MADVTVLIHDYPRDISVEPSNGVCHFPHFRDKNECETMKRSLNEITESSQAVGRPSHLEDQDEDRARKLMKSHSRRGSAAMTLIALAVSEYQRRSSEASNTNLPVVNSMPVNQCTTEGKDACMNPLPTIPTRTPRRGSYKEFVFECGALHDDWKLLCRPLPLPPQLPSFPMSTRSLSIMNKIG